MSLLDMSDIWALLQSVSNDLGTVHEQSFC
jgi:hypothetical protein